MARQSFKQSFRNASSDEKFAITLAAFISCALCLFVVHSNWTAIKGSHFTDISSLETTAGIIISSEIVRGSPKSSSLHYDIKYEFKVQERLYESTSISFGSTGHPDPAFARSYVRKYPPGQRVMVYYDPDDPSFSVLEPEVQISYIGLLASPIIFGLFFLVSLFWMCRRTQKRA